MTDFQNDVKASTPPKATKELGLEENNLKPSTAAKHFSTKAKHSQPRFLTLLVCVSYLLLNILGVDLGLRLINGYTEPRFERAKVQFEAVATDYNLGLEVKLKLDRLLMTMLDRNYIETYEQCLASGIQEAEHDTFRGLDWAADAEVRNLTMDWVTWNCGRLRHEPQLHTPEVLSVWTRAKNLGRLAKEADSLLVHKAAQFVYSLLGMEPWFSTTEATRQRQNASTTSWVDDEVTLATMPSGFSLDCAEPSPCRLVYSGPTNPPISRDTVDEVLKEAIKWEKLSFEKILRLNGYFIDWMTLLQPLFGSCVLLSILIPRRCRPRPQPQPRMLPSWARICYAIAHTGKDEELAIGLIINTSLYALVRYQLQYITSEFDRALLPAGAGFCAFYFPQILIFFDPVSQKTESIRSACRSTSELFKIFRGVEVEKPTPTKRLLSARKTAAPTLKPASKIATRFISPLTPISEDLRQERKAMHAEQGKQPRVAFEPEVGYATETDSDSDSDVEHASYVDLTGGATPTVSEDGSDWSVVED